MPLAITDEHVELAAVVRAFGQRHDVLGAARAALDAPSEERGPVFAQVAAEAWLGLHLPEAVGGAGYGLPELAIVLEELGRVVAPGPILSTVAASAVLAAVADADLAARWLPGLANGSLTGGIGFGALVLGGGLADVMLIARGDDMVAVERADASAEPRDSLDPTARVARVVVAEGAGTRLVGARPLALAIARALAAAEAAGVANGCSACREDPDCSSAATRGGCVMADYTEVQVADDQGVRTVTLDKPSTLNALGRVNTNELLDALRTADDDDDVRCVVLTGTGRGFCVGADLKEMMANRTEHGSGAGARTSRAMAMSPLGQWNRLLNVIRDFHKPLIAAVNGLAVGGGLLLACAADLRIAADDAEFSAIFAQRGLAFEAGASYYLPRLVGLEEAFRMVYTADRYPAADALRMGLVGEVVPAADLQEHTHTLALRIAAMPTLQLGLARMEILKGMAFDDPNVSMMIEMFALGVSQRSADYEEGHVSFIEKRDPKFIGH